MNNILPEELKQLAAVFPSPLYVVGGAVRDYIAGLVPAVRDWDICAPAPFSRVLECAQSLGFTLTAQYAATGSLKLTFGGVGYEFTSFRTDTYSGCGHAPEKVVFTDDICADARRRDFTCNAVYYDICAGQFVDPLGGIEHIRARKLVPCAPAAKLFSEDARRILRLARFAGELNFVADDECVSAALDCADGLSGLSPAISWRELSSMFGADEKYGLAGGCKRSLGVLDQTGALVRVFPSVAALGQNSVARAVAAAGRAPAGLRLHAFLYALGGQKAEEALEVYPLPKQFRIHLSRLIDAARFAGRGAKVRVFVRENNDVFGDVCAIRRAAVRGGAADGWEQTRRIMLQEGVPMNAADLAVRGEDLINAGVPQAKTGQAIAFLLDKCLKDGSLNNKTALIALAKQHYRVK